MSDLSLKMEESGLGRDQRFDVIKGICALGVVGVHFAGSFIGRPGIRWEPAFFVGVYWNQIFTFAVPVFLFISGYLNGRREYPSISNYYGKRLWGLLPQYFLVCIAWWFLFPHADFIQDLTWDNIFIRLFYRGIQGTQYFVLAIMQLFLLAPIIRWLVAFSTKKIHKHSVYFFALFFLVLHVMIGNACFNGKLNYYYYCLPFSPFWLFFFFFGLYARKLLGFMSDQLSLKVSLALLAIGAVISQAYNLYRCSTPEIAGVESNLLPFDFAYSRPVMIVYDLCVVAVVALALVHNQTGFLKRLSWFRFFGRYSYEIYLWHLVLLQYVGWGNLKVMQLCENYPAFIVLVCLFVCVLISFFRYIYDLLISIVRRFCNFVPTWIV
ncbi:MAG: acyltransferase [Desulfobulbaceae bacterium]|nr:acyltransferase [Desulfobulbaceae bacterium]